MDYGVFEEVDEKFITKYDNTYGECVYAYEIESIGFAILIYHIRIHLLLLKFVKWDFNSILNIFLGSH